MLQRIAIVTAFLLVLSAPFLARMVVGGAASAGPATTGARTLIVVTPHIEQIRLEFAAGFDRWHRRVHGEPAHLDFRSPGGTTEIIKILAAQFETRIREGRITPGGACPPGTIDFDVFFGGGSFDHGRVRTGVTVADVPLPGGALGKVSLSMSVPPDPPFTESELAAVFGENTIGSGKLYQDNRSPEKPADWQHWIGTALSGFGIVYNRDSLRELGLPEPASFADLTDGRYAGRLALADPRQSGSVATAYDSILNNEGFDRGFRILRELCASARYFSPSSTQPPTDVAQGDAAAAIAIDFYGRGQAQAILRPGEPPESARVAYVDPPGRTYVDADPVSILRGGPDPVLARRFVEYCLTTEAQALWQFPPTSLAEGQSNPPIPGVSPPAPLGPHTHRLRRMPVRRDLYAPPYLEFFADRTDPFTIASATKVRGWRSGMIVMMGAFGVDSADELRAAWAALRAARADAAFPKDRLAEMESLFYALPEHTLKDGTTLPFNEANYRTISDDVKSWSDKERGPLARIAYTEFFRSNYRRVVALATLNPS